MNSRLLSVILLLTLCAVPSGLYASEAAEREADAGALWDEIVRAYVRAGHIDGIRLNVVDYQSIAADERWPCLLKALEEAVEPEGREEKLAFWINAYNIMAVHVILQNYPVDSIRDIGNIFRRVWHREAGVVAGEMRTLDEIEHRIIRPIGEARIHAAVVCAAVSCPPLRMEAYRAERLDEQLDEQMREWLANEKTGVRAERDGSRLVVSSIFRWFTEDFEQDSGSLRAFLDKYMPEDVRASVPADARIRYLDYDWSLNDAKRSDARP